MERPEFYKDEYGTYLTGLRDSGKTNMWGALPYLQRSFHELALDKEKAEAVMDYWMESC